MGILFFSVRRDKTYSPAGVSVSARSNISYGMNPIEPNRFRAYISYRDGSVGSGLNPTNQSKIAVALNELRQARSKGVPDK